MSATDSLVREVDPLGSGGEPPRHRRDPESTFTHVVSETAAGPVLSGSKAPRRRVRPTTFVQALGARTRILIAAFSIGWLASLVFFWSWWFMPGHRVGWAGFVINTVLLAYLAYLPGYFLFTANRLRHVDPALPVPALRVAFVVTRAPSEPWPVARGTLKAMLGQSFPGAYDVWLCDEAPTGEITAWCAGNGVHLSSRQGVVAYHRAEWPRRTKCKEGNLAYFYDHWGYRDYDVVSQLDCDHVPSPTYLSEMVRPFGDPAIGYVAAPSVCEPMHAGARQ